MSDTTYNGWSNYAIWSIALFIDNDEEWYDTISLIVKDYKKDILSVGDTISKISNFIEEMIMTDDLNCYQAQMLQASLGDVDYVEILKHYTDQ